jgi:uncharacterized protein YjiS (DUF1127 family)
MMKGGTFLRSCGALVTASVRIAATFVGGGSRELARWWLGGDKSRHALAELDDDELSNLSDIGRQIRREERRARKRI